MNREPMSRRDVLKRGVVGVAGLAASTRLASAGEKIANTSLHDPEAMGTVGRVTAGSIDPIRFLSDFYYGDVTTLENGQVLRTYYLQAVDRNIEIAPGVFFPAWTYNGQVPGPTLRATAGDMIRVHFQNLGTHPHTIHFHGIHSASMDGVFEIVSPGESFVYEFEARPFGLHLYHCHTMPLKKHIAKGLYGAFIIDPPTPRPAAREMVMVMNGFDTNFDGANEVYAVNSIAFAYKNQPITVVRGKLQRIYLVNMTEFDPINSLHIHANLFNVFRTGTSLNPHEYTDTIMMCQGERHIVEFTYDETGLYMFHAHQSEFAELGWMGLLNVVDPVA